MLTFKYITPLPQKQNFFFTKSTSFGSIYFKFKNKWVDLLKGLTKVHANVKIMIIYALITIKT